VPALTQRLRFQEHAALSPVELGGRLNQVNDVHRKSAELSVADKSLKACLTLTHGRAHGLTLADL
jgi:hypothetical protein